MQGAQHRKNHLNKVKPDFFIQEEEAVRSFLLNQTVIVQILNLYIILYMYSVVSLLSVFYPFPAIHSLLVTILIKPMKYIVSGCSASWIPLILVVVQPCHSMYPRASQIPLVQNAFLISPNNATLIIQKMPCQLMYHFPYAIIFSSYLNYLPLLPYLSLWPRAGKQAGQCKGKITKKGNNYKTQN